MTKNTITIKIECAGNSLELGPDKPCDITKVTGLESVPVDSRLLDLTDEAGSVSTGIHPKARPIHIEAGFKSSATALEDREKLIHLFGSTEPVRLTVTVGEQPLSTFRRRYIYGFVEGWTLRERPNMDTSVSFVADIICPYPYFISGTDLPLIPISGGAINVPNDGDAPAGWIAFAPAGSYPNGLTISGPGGYMKLTPFVAGGEVVIDTNRLSISVKVGGGSRFDLLDITSTPWRIPVGGCAVSAEGGSVTLAYYESYAGI